MENISFEAINKLNEPGNKIVRSIDLDEYGNIIAIGYVCDKPGCNCNGGWTDGDCSESVEHIIINQN